MSYRDSFSQSDDYRRTMLIKQLEHSIEQLSLQELEAVYYDMQVKGYIG